MVLSQKLVRNWYDCRPQKQTSSLECDASCQTVPSFQVSGLFGALGVGQGADPLWPQLTNSFCVDVDPDFRFCWGGGGWRVAPTSGASKKNSLCRSVETAFPWHRCRAAETALLSYDPADCPVLWGTKAEVEAIGVPWESILSLTKSQ